MKNKTLAIFGIAAYVLSVITSGTDMEGNSIMPTALIIISAVAILVFIVMAIIRLWRIMKSASILLALSNIIFFILSLAVTINTPPYGSPLIILMNIFKVVNFIVFIWVILLLWEMAKIMHK